MAINIPDNAAQIDKRSKSDVQASVKNSNPFLPNSWIGALITSISNRIFDFYQQLRIALDETFFDTSTGERLQRQASWFRVYKKDSTKGFGNAIFTGIAGSVIDAGKEISTTNSVKFTTNSQVEISANVVNLSSLTSSVGVASATTVSPHNLSNNVEVTIFGANESAYNITTSITIISENEFNFTIDESAPSVATGVIQASYNSAIVGITSVVEGAQNNISAGELLSLSESIAGVDSNVGIDANGTAGGTDLESQDAFRGRFINRVQNPVAHFNEADIRNKLLEVAGVTRVFIRPITPEVGQVTIYFTKDAAENIIPSGADIDFAKSKLLEIKPANTADDDVILTAPIAILSSFNFTSIVPNTPTMKTSITNQLKDLFLRTEEGVDVTQDEYRTEIYNTVDITTGERIKSFTLSAPVGDIIVYDGELAILDQVIFS
jgi:uncharacterized phage protein gp47/JayE